MSAPTRVRPGAVRAGRVAPAVAGPPRFLVTDRPDLPYGLGPNGYEVSTLTTADFYRETGYAEIANRHARTSGLGMVDFFCGAGGSSQGAAAAGIEPKYAANHWQQAIETFIKNHPDTGHYRGDLHGLDMKQFPSAELFWASPACPEWTHASGKPVKYNKQASLGEMLDDPEEAAKMGHAPDEAAERSRALMWDVPKYLEAQDAKGERVLAGVVENVVQCRDWIAWDEWIRKFHDLGYRTKVIALNSMHAEPRVTPRAPQSRDRLYVAYWHKSLGRDPDWSKWLRPTVHCPTCDETVQAVQVFKKPGVDMGRYSVRYGQYVYRCPRVTCRNQIIEPAVTPASAAIDFTLKGQRIGDRARPLKPKTLARIEAGLLKYGRDITLEASGHTFERRPGVRTRPTDWPLTTLHTGGSKAWACPPLLIPSGGTWRDAASPLGLPMPARTTSETDGLLVPLRKNGVASRTSVSPLPTFAASGTHHALIMRNNTPRKGSDGGYLSTPVTEPLGTLTTAGHQSLIGLDLLYAYDTGQLRHPGRSPLPTQTTIEGDALVGASLNIDDCTFRMLEPYEAGAGMAFTGGYTVLGDRTARFRQYGNAVTPPTAEVILWALRECITGEEIDREPVAA